MKVKPNEFKEFLAIRRSTRDFLPTKVPSDVLDGLLRDGLTAPSWSNTRPFMVAVAEGQLRDEISADFLARWKVAAGLRSGSIAEKIRFFFTPSAWPLSDYFMIAKYPPALLKRSQRVGRELYSLLGVARGDKKGRDEQWAKNYEFFGAPTVLFVFIHKKLGVFAANDAGLFAENLMLSAHAQGLGTCAQGAVALWPSAIRKRFNVPKDYKLIYGIAIGYPSDAQVNGFGANRIGPEELVIPERTR
jgi:nitroreductase